MKKLWAKKGETPAELTANYLATGKGDANKLSNPGAASDNALILSTGLMQRASLSGLLLQRALTEVCGPALQKQFMRQDL